MRFSYWWFHCGHSLDRIIVIPVINFLGSYSSKSFVLKLSKCNALHSSSLFNVTNSIPQDHFLAVC